MSRVWEYLRSALRHASHACKRPMQDIGYSLLPSMEAIKISCRSIREELSAVMPCQCWKWWLCWSNSSFLLESSAVWNNEYQKEQGQSKPGASLLSDIRSVKQTLPTTQDNCVDSNWALMQVISHGTEQHSLQVVLTVPSVVFVESALQAAISNDSHWQAAKAWLASRDIEGLTQETAVSGGQVPLRLDSRSYMLQANRDFLLPNGAFAKLKSSFRLNQ